MVLPKQSLLLRAFGKANALGKLRGKAAARAAQAIRIVHAQGRNATGASAANFPLPEAANEEGAERGREIPTLGLLTSCVLHAMMRPRGALVDYLGPLLDRLGAAPVVTLFAVGCHEVTYAPHAAARVVHVRFRGFFRQPRPRRPRRPRSSRLRPRSA